MITISCIYLSMVIIGIIIFIYEAKKAPIVDDKEPFLWGDYDDRKKATSCRES